VGTLSPPAPLTAQHSLADFRCSEPVLEQWLLRRALQNQVGGASRTYVVCDSQNVIGYYSLAAGSVATVEAPGNVSRNMPDPIPVVVLGRLAVHLDYEGQGIGTGLLKDALLRCLNAAEHVGVRAMLCHALSDKAKRFYVRHGFIESPIHAMTLMLRLNNRLTDLSPPGKQTPARRK
jgi:GNAT superfamily N-acetyltransferase